MGKEMKLKVYYGWSKINAVRKKISLSVMFENTLEARSVRGKRTLSCIQDTCYVRDQDAEEMEDATKQNRIFTGYDLMLEEKRFKGSLDKILQYNSEADKNHTSKKTRKDISESLRKAFMIKYPDYKEPVSQLDLFQEP